LLNHFQEINVEINELIETKKVTICVEILLKSISPQILVK
jgi:hypothetical protein